MDLITSELTKYKTLCQQLTKNNESIKTELNLLQNLIDFEQKFNKHLNDLVLCYEKNINFKHFNNFNDFFAKQLITKQKEIELKKLRQELNDWRKINNSLSNYLLLIISIYFIYLFFIQSTANGNQKTDQSYCSEKTTESDNQSILKTILNERSVKRKSIKLKSKSSENQTRIKPNVIFIRDNEPTVEPMVSVFDIQKQTEEPLRLVQLEIIPKPEPISDGEETESASEGKESASESTKSASEGEQSVPMTRGKPFQFASEYFYKNRSKSNNNKTSEERKKASNKETVNKSIEIDLNNDSNNDLNETTTVQPIGAYENNTTIFDNEIIDLTPKTPTPKKSCAKRGQKY